MSVTNTIEGPESSRQNPQTPPAELQQGDVTQIVIEREPGPDARWALEIWGPFEDNPQWHRVSRTSLHLSEHKTPADALQAALYFIRQREPQP